MQTYTVRFLQKKWPSQEDSRFAEVKAALPGSFPKNPAISRQVKAKLNGHPNPVLTPSIDSLLNDTSRVRDLVHVEAPHITASPSFPMVIGYDATLAALRDSRFQDSSGKGRTRFISGRNSSRKRANSNSTEDRKLRTLASLLDLAVMFSDDEVHSKLHVLMSSLFKKDVVSNLEGVAREECDRILQELPRDELGRVDVLNDYASKLAVSMISRLLGLPESKNRLYLGFMREVTKGVDLSASFEERVAANETALKWYKDIELIVGDPTFLESNKKIFGNKTTDSHGLTEEQMITNILFLFIAGHETTQNFILFSLFEALSNPDIKRQIQSNPSFPWDNFQAEVLRTHPVAQIIQRTARTDVDDFFGISLKAGQSFKIGIGAALHDPRRFAHPEKFDMGRGSSVAEHSLAFGAGPHICIGRHLALLEGRIALEKLFKAHPNLRFSSEPPFLDPNSYNTARFGSFVVAGVNP